MSSIGNITEESSKTVICNLESDVIDRILTGQKSIYLSAKSPRKQGWDGFVYFFDKQKRKVAARCTIEIFHIWDIRLTLEEISKNACIPKKNMLHYSDNNFNTTIMVWFLKDVTESSLDIPYKHSAVGWYYHNI